MIDTSIKTEFSAALVGSLVDAVNSRSAQASQQLADKLYTWLRLETRKRVTHQNGTVSWVHDATQLAQANQTDLPGNLAAAKEWLGPLALDLRLTVLSGGQFELRAGAYDSYLTQLAYGSMWFEGHPDLAMFIILELAGSI